MINFELCTFLPALEDLTRDVNYTRYAADENDGLVDEAQHSRLEANTKRIFRECGKLGLDGASNASLHLEDMFRRYRIRKYKYSEITNALFRLLDDLRMALMDEYFFHYPREIAELIHRVDFDWEATLSGFPSSRRGIMASIDCYALGDYSGCVFHMMGLAELGLRAIAGERGIEAVGNNKPIEWGTWQDVFQAIEGQLKVIRSRPPGPKKDAALSFYDTALSDLRRLQGYRDPTMHFRQNYDKGEAYDAMYRTKSLMQTLSTKLSEGYSGQIEWGL